MEISYFGQMFHFLYSDFLKPYVSFYCNEVYVFVFVCTIRCMCVSTSVYTNSFLVDAIQSIVSFNF